MTRVYISEQSLIRKCKDQINVKSKRSSILFDPDHGEAQSN